jgi:hypothetical protein
MTLLISKINNIQVIQVGESKLTVTNKRVDSSKNGAGEKDGNNSTVDKGKGKEQHTIKLYVFDAAQNKEIFEVLHKKRFCDISDKYKGKISVYVDSFDVVNNGTHSNRTTYALTCTVQDAKYVIGPNFSIALKSAINGIKGEIVDDVQDLSDEVVDVSKNPLTEVIEFVDSALELVNEGITTIMDAQSKVLGAYTAVKSKIDKIKRMGETIQGIIDFPKDLSSLLTGLMDDVVSVVPINANKVPTGGIRRFKKSELTPVAEPVVRGVLASLIDRDDLSPIELGIMDKDLIATRIVNKVKLGIDMQLMLAGGFGSQDDFESTVDSIVERLDHVGYEEWQKGDLIRKVKGFANEQQYRAIIEIEVKRDAPLMRIVYEKYGGLEQYDDIEAINNLKDNDYVSGMVRVFE